MSNRYCNLNGDNPVNQEYPLITDGFDDVQLEMDAEVAKVAAHIAGTADKHNASNIVNDSDVSGAEVKAALNTLKGLYDNMSIGASNTAIGVFSANAAGTNTLTSTIAGIAAYFGGLKANLTIANTNTGAATWNLNSLGAKAIKVLGADGTKYDLVGGEMTIGSKVQLEYDGTYMIAINIQKASNSTPVTVTQPITTLPSTAMPGLLESTLAGNTLVNAVVNPDFANGTTGWTAYGSTLSATNKLLTATGTAATRNVGLFQLQNLIYQANKKIKVGSRVRVTDAVCGKIIIEILSSDGSAVLGSVTYSTPTQNTWYDFSALASSIISLISGTAGDKIKLYIYAQYADAATASGKVMEIDGNTGVVAIDLGTSSSDLNYNKTNAELNNMIGGVLQNGINGVSGLRVLSTGKNLFDNRFNINGSHYSSTGTIDSVSSPTIASRSNFYISVKEGSNYKLSKAVLISLYDKNKAHLSRVSITTSILIPTGVSYIRVSSSNEGYNYLDNMQIEENTVATTYESYVSSSQDSNKPMYSLPNGVADRIYWADGKRYFEQNIMPYTLVSGDITSLVTSGTNADIVTISKKADSKDYSDSTTSLTNSQRREIPNFKAGSVYSDALSSIGTQIDYISTLTALYVAKGAYADVAAARTDLVTNKATVMAYQLATPIVTEIEGTERLIARPNGSIAITPTIKFEAKPSVGVITKPTDMSTITSVESVRKITMNSDGTITYLPVTPSSFTTTTITLPAGYDDTKFYEVVCSHTSQNCVTPSLTYSYPTNIRGEVDGMLSWVNSLDKNLGELNDFTVAYLLNIEARLTAHSI